MNLTAHSGAESSLQVTLRKPLVTVIACCYNHSAFVVESLESIRQQTYPHVQLIVTDDASTDDSDAVITNWMSRHRVACTYLRHRTNKGICKTLNEALSHATGKYIAILATDDIWMVDKLDYQVKLMEKLPEKVGVLYSDAIQIDEAGTILPQYFIEAHTAAPPAEGNIFSQLLDRNFIPAMTTLIRTSCYETVGLYDERLCFEDLDMWLRIAQHYHFSFSPKVSAKRRIVSTSLTSTLIYTESREMLKTFFCMDAKLIKSGSLTFAQAFWKTQHLVSLAERMYQCHYREATVHLFRAFLADRRRRTLTMGLCSAIGMSYSQFCQLFNCLGSLKRSLCSIYSRRRDRHVSQNVGMELVRAETPKSDGETH